MKLHKLQIAQFCAGLPGHHYPVAARQAGVGGVGEKVASTTGGQHHRPAGKPVDAVCLEHGQAHTAALLQPELPGHNPLALFEPGPEQHLPFQGFHQGPAGAVLGMQHPPVAVGGLQGCAQIFAVAVEGHAQLQQARHAGWSVMHEPLNRRMVTEPSPRHQGVVDVALKAVVRSCYCGDTSLGPPAGGSWRAAGITVLAEQQHPQMAGQLQAGHEPGCTAANHHHIPGLLCHGG